MNRISRECHLIHMRRSDGSAGIETLNQKIAKILLSFLLGVLVMLTGSLVYSNIRESRFSAHPGKSRQLQSAPMLKDVSASVDVNPSEDQSKAEQQDGPSFNSVVQATALGSTHPGKRPAAIAETSHSGRERIEAGASGSENPGSDLTPTLISRSGGVNTSEPQDATLSQVSSGLQSGTAQQVQHGDNPFQGRAVEYPQNTPAVLPQARPETKPPEPEPKMLIVQPGTRIEVRLTESLSSDHNRTGEVFRVTLASPITVNGFVVARGDSAALGRIVQARRAPLLGGNSDLTLTLTNITINDGSLTNVESSLFEQQGSRSNILNTAKMATGAAVGAAIGAVTGAAEGAGITSAMKNGDRTNGFMATKRTVVLPAGMGIAFTLAAPLTIPQPTGERP